MSTPVKDNWADRPKGMRCATCMYWVCKMGIVGRCRRRSPTMNGWPVLFNTDWCGDHKLNEATVDQQPQASPEASQPKEKEAAA